MRSTTYCRIVTILLAALAPHAPGWAECGAGQNSTTFCGDQGQAGVADVPELGDRLGASLAFGDFDGDGRLDLAVGVPGEDRDAGAVHVFPGDGPNVSAIRGSLFFTQHDLAGENSAPDEEFGAALAAADFDGDGFDDLAIGAPLEDRDDCVGFQFRRVRCTDDGVIHIVPGSALGLLPGAARTFSSRDLLGTPAGSVGSDDGSRLGAALATLDANGDGLADLAVSMPGFNFGGPSEDGRVFLLFGTPNGLVSPGRELPPPVAGSGEQFGSVLVGGDFDGDGRDELVVGIPERALSGVTAAGAVEIFRVGTLIDRLLQTDFGLAGFSARDHFGAALAVGDFDGDGRQDLAIGTPEKNHGPGNPNDSGRVYVAFGAAGGLDPRTFQILGEDDFAGQAPQAGDRFGAALAAGDLDDDGFDDLVLGAPGEGSDDRGFVYVLHGSPTGLRVFGGALFSEPFLGGTAQSNAQFGTRLAVGDVGGDGRAEIAIGVELANVGSRTNAGTVYATRALQP